MLGKKKFLWTNLWFTIIACAVYFQLAGRWAVLCNDALPDNSSTAFFYYMIPGIIGAWYVSQLCLRFWKWNTARYHEQYELEVNNFLYHYVELMDHKLNRHKEFKELRDLLQLAISLSKGEQQCSR